MDYRTHLLSLTAGAVTGAEVLTEIEIPNSKEKIIALAASVLVQGAIMGLAELRKWLNRRKRRKAEAVG